MTYTEYFGLKENPFSIAPDPHYFYISERHREALAHLMYGFYSEGGFVLLTGGVGTGKTTVCRRMLGQAPEDCDIAFILYPKLSPEELLATVCDEFGIDCPDPNATSRVLVALIYDYLVKTHEAGRKAILILEEAQNLSDDVLEQVRLLTNLETSKRKLLQIVMLGQPELGERLSRPELRQLSQRITARYHLGPLSRKEISEYIDHRLSVAGLARGGLFPPSVVKELYRLTGGVPRLINVVCDRALMGAHIQMKDRVDRKTLMMAAREVLGAGERRPRRGLYGTLSIIVLAGLCAALAVAGYGRTILSFPAALFTATGHGKAPVGQTGANLQGQASLESIPAKPEIPQARSGTLAKDRAFQALFGAWQIRYEPGAGDVCSQAKGQGLACLEGKGNLAGLRSLNKPAVLRFSSTDNGTDGYVALTSLGPAKATVVDGDGTKVVDVKDLSGRWSGEYLVLWRIPSGYGTEVKQGDHGPFVAWVGKQLALLQGHSAGSGRDGFYDDEMAQAVKEFQITVGLVPDGKVGPRTLIALTDRSGNGGPSLYNTQRRP